MSEDKVYELGKKIHVTFENPSSPIPWMIFIIVLFLLITGSIWLFSSKKEKMGRLMSKSETKPKQTEYKPELCPIHNVSIPHTAI